VKHGFSFAVSFSTIAQVFLSVKLQRENTKVIEK
jgi:hypothetical protein